MTMGIPVKRYVRKKNVNDPSSPDYYYLKFVGKRQKTHDIKRIASRIESIGALSAEDVEHVINSFVRELRTSLVEGNKVKVNNLGTFFLSFNCIGAPEAKDCTVKNIRKVNIRFKPDSSLRLANDATASVRGDSNNVVFYLEQENGNGEYAGSEDMENEK